LVSVNRRETGSGNGDCFFPALSASGLVVAFTSYASDLVAHDTNGTTDVFVHDPWKERTTLVSINRTGTDSGNGDSFFPVLSASGLVVAFMSNASDLVANDTNGAGDVFVRDLWTGRTTLVSVNRTGTGSGNDFSNFPVLSASGRLVAFESAASDLVANNTNGAGDVFVRDLWTRTTTLVSINRTGTGGNDFSNFPVFSADGRLVAFTSYASDLVAHDTNGTTDVFVRPFP